MKRVILSIAAIALVCQVAGAQNLLRNLGNKAINKATNSVEKKVEKKVEGPGKHFWQEAGPAPAAGNNRIQ